MMRNYKKEYENNKSNYHRFTFYLNTEDAKKFKNKLADEGFKISNWVVKKIQQYLKGN